MLRQTNKSRFYLTIELGFHIHIGWYKYGYFADIIPNSQPHKLNTKTNRTPDHSICHQFPWLNISRYYRRNLVLQETSWCSLEAGRFGCRASIHTLICSQRYPVLDHQSSKIQIRPWIFCYHGIQRNLNTKQSWYTAAWSVIAIQI